MNRITEQWLVQRSKRGDRNAAAQLIDAHYHRVYTFHFSFCKNKEIAEDLTQDTFIKAWQALPQFNSGSRVSTWLFRIAYNTFVDWRRRQRQWDSMDAADQSFSPAFFDGVTENILDAIRALPAKQRKVIVFHYQHDFSIRETAKILGVSAGTVKSRLNAALQQLRQCQIIKELRP